MLKIMFVFVALATMFNCPGGAPAPLKENVMFSCYNGGKEVVISADDAAKIDEMLCASLGGCRRLPALGVSLHDDTLKALQEGVWLRFSFGERLEIDELPFDELLIKMERDMYGFNVIRGNEGRYEGRCFYVDIHSNLDSLYDFLCTLPVSDKPFELKKPVALDGHEGIILDALQENLPDGGAPSTLGRIEIPSINKDKEKQNTVIKQGEQDSDTPPLDQLTFKNT